MIQSFYMGVACEYHRYAGIVCCRDNALGVVGHFLQFRNHAFAAAENVHNKQCAMFDIQISLLLPFGFLRYWYIWHDDSFFRENTHL